MSAQPGLSVSAVSHQLRLLRSLGLVKYRKEGRLACYSLTDEHTRQLLWDVLEHLQGGKRQRAKNDMRSFDDLNNFFISADP